MASAEKQTEPKGEIPPPANEAQAQKRRGRPPGSKNAKKDEGPSRPFVSTEPPKKKVTMELPDGVIEVVALAPLTLADLVSYLFTRKREGGWVPVSPNANKKCQDGAVEAFKVGVGMVEVNPWVAYGVCMAGALSTAVAMTVLVGQIEKAANDPGVKDLLSTIGNLFNGAMQPNGNGAPHDAKSVEPMEVVTRPSSSQGSTP